MVMLTFRNALFLPQLTRRPAAMPVAVGSCQRSVLPSDLGVTAVGACGTSTRQLVGSIPDTPRTLSPQRHASRSSSPSRAVHRSGALRALGELGSGCGRLLGLTGLLSRDEPGGFQGLAPAWPREPVLELPQHLLPCRVPLDLDKAQPRRQESTQQPAKAIFSSPAWKWQEIISVPPEESFTDILHGAISAQNYLLPFRTFKIISIAEKN